MVAQQVSMGYHAPPPRYMVGRGEAVMVDPTGKTALANFGTAVVNRLTNPDLIRQGTDSGLSIGRAIAQSQQAKNKALKEAGKSTRAERQSDIRQAQAMKKVSAVESRSKIQEKRLDMIEKKLARKEDIRDAKHQRKLTRLKS